MPLPLEMLNGSGAEHLGGPFNDCSTPFYSMQEQEQQDFTYFPYSAIYIGNHT